MSVADLVLLVVAGFGAGLVGYITGMASLISYPALLAVGLGPIAANVTNTIALVPVGAGSFAQSGRVLLDGDRRPFYSGIVAAAIGGTIGAVLLLVTPDEAFSSVVPWLVAVAAVALLAQPWLQRLATSHGERPWIWFVGTLVIAVYGGYFGAGAGIFFLALAMVVSTQPLWRAALQKSAFLGVANLIAAVVFIATGPVEWSAAIAMGIGCLAGGWCGPPVVRRLPAEPLRIAVGIGGLGLAIWLATR
ncbi:sulfite exporter TauE/SafE family protein [Gordonia soli]|uniref:Probable membrane transporter protein n=1 Tax=Gordonia soli NBRC 108243 TaxID=1223545 RepID=M0QQ85_9ACTN|nr:sulfite exporter TauE/SafE family protein [Gordonia soli]GAC70386.1 hypothetical protein GS4_34_00720 [Gordonia soli NBRC 108243]